MGVLLLEVEVADLAPKGRSELARYLNRVCAHFVDVDPDGPDADAVRGYRVTLRSDRTERTLTPAQAAGRQILDQRSLPSASIGRSEVEVFVDRCRSHYRHPGRTVSAGTIKRWPPTSASAGTGPSSKATSPPTHGTPSGSATDRCRPPDR